MFKRIWAFILKQYSESMYIRLLLKYNVIDWKYEEKRNVIIFIIFGILNNNEELYDALHSLNRAFLIRQNREEARNE